MEPGSTGPATAGHQAEPAIIVTDLAWHRRVPGAVAIARRAALAAGGTPTVVLASDRMVQQLNARHRGRNRPTNVLSFPGTDEIIVALGVVCREAALSGESPLSHLAHLVVHGTLHLAGLDHHQPGEARRMELAEARALHRLGFPNPWKRR